jgi:hypothetical protein
MKRLGVLLLFPFLSACNQLEDIPFVDTQAPTLLTAENMDLSGDQFTDTIKLTFDEWVRDEAITGSDFSVDQITTINFQFDTNGDVSHNEIIHLTIDDGVYGVGTGFDLTYTAGTLSDLAGNLLADTTTTTLGVTP